MASSDGSARAARLAADLEAAAAALISVLERVPPDRWMTIPGPGVWSVGKEAVHVAEAAVYHQWIVRLSIGEPVSSKRPQIERTELTTDLSPHDAVELVRRRTDEGVTLLRALTEAQLALPTRPPRARDAGLADTIERVLIGHYLAHRDDIATKLRTGVMGD